MVFITKIIKMHSQKILDRRAGSYIGLTSKRAYMSLG
jgi:hypothetical protein